MIDLVPVDPKFVFALDADGLQWERFEVIGAGHVKRCFDCGSTIVSGWVRGAHGQPEYYCDKHFKIVQQHVPQLFIITKAHHQDYVSAEAWIAPGTDKKETLIRVILTETDRWFDEPPDPMGYDNGDASRYYQYDIEAYEEFKEELAKLQAMSLYDIEQHDRDDGNAWSIEEFRMPDLSDGSVHQICKLDTD